MATESRPGYCSVADLRANIAGLTVDNQKVTEDFLVDLICRKSSVIDSYICNQYIVPITEQRSPVSYSILKDICIAMAKPPISDKLKISTPKMLDEKGNQFPVHEGLSRAHKLLDLIKDGKHKLPDAIRCADCGAFSSGYYDTTDVDGIPLDVPYGDPVDRADQ